MTIVRAGRQILDEVTASIAPAGITVVSGSSGAGKTTLPRLCNRLEIPGAGVVSYRTATIMVVIARGLIRRLFTPDHRLIHLPAPADQ